MPGLCHFKIAKSKYTKTAVKIVLYGNIMERNRVQLQVVNIKITRDKIPLKKYIRNCKTKFSNKINLERENPTPQNKCKNFSIKNILSRCKNDLGYSPAYHIS